MGNTSLTMSEINRDELSEPSSGGEGQSGVNDQVGNTSSFISLLNLLIFLLTLCCSGSLSFYSTQQIHLQTGIPYYL